MRNLRRITAVAVVALAAGSFGACNDLNHSVTFDDRDGLDFRVEITGLEVFERPCALGDTFQDEARDCYCTQALEWECTFDDETAESTQLEMAIAFVIEAQSASAVQVESSPEVAAELGVTGYSVQLDTATDALIITALSAAGDVSLTTDASCAGTTACEDIDARVGTSAFVTADGVALAIEFLNDIEEPMLMTVSSDFASRDGARPERRVIPTEDGGRIIVDGVDTVPEHVGYALRGIDADTPAEPAGGCFGVLLKLSFTSAACVVLTIFASPGPVCTQAVCSSCEYCQCKANKDCGVICGLASSLGCEL